MFDAIIAFSLRQRALVLLCALALVAGGIYAFSRLPIDAVPDITNNQVQILTSAPTYSPLEIERYVTFPVEVAVKSLPDVIELRSLSRPGLSMVTVVFNDNVDIYFARQQILEKLREVEEDIPEGVERPELGPVSTGLGEIFRYVIHDTTGRLSPMDLRTIQDWIVRRELLGTPGLAEVNSLGGAVQQYHVLVKPEALVSYGLTLRDVFDAVAATSGNAGGAYIETGPEQLSVRSVGLATGIEDVRNTLVKTTSTGTPVMLGDVADVEIGSAIRFGSASQDGKGEVVTGITMQLKGANARVTVNAVKERIAQIQQALPDGVIIEPYYDREVLVDRTIQTVATNLIEGALLVIGVLLLFLVNLRAGIILASVIPLSMMFAGILMLLTGQSGNLMSLGAIDFGLVVDGSLIIVENVLRLMEERFRNHSGTTLSSREMRDLVYGGSVEVRKAAQFGEIIIIVVYLPILTLQGIEGKLFQPMALTVSYALLGALILSITYVPVMLSMFLKRSGSIRHSPIITFLHRYYPGWLRRGLKFRVPILAATLTLFAGAMIAFTRMGGEFIPRLDEGDIAMHIIRLPSVSLTESQAITTRVERELMKFPEVQTVVSSTGRAEISTDPMGFELADAFVMLKPHEEWGTGRTKAELIEAMEEALEDVPGAGVQFLQPIEMRTNELISGARGDVVVKVRGEDFAVMNRAAEQIAAILRATEGGADVTVEQTTGLPQLLIRPNRSAIARYGLSVEEVNNIITTAIAGRKAGEVAEGERRFDIVVKLPEYERTSVGAISRMMVITPGGERVPLSTIADVSVKSGPVQISREDGSRFVSVQANVRGRDVESYVEEASQRIDSEVVLPAGYIIDYGGQFENLQRASDRLMVVVPIALVLIFLLLFQTFRSFRLGVMIFLCVPMAVIGGVAALLVAGLPFSISAGVGFIALFGIAVLNGIVMVAAIRKFQAQGLDRRSAVLAGAEERLRPVVTTAALAGFGFLPMLLARSAGAEVQRPLATVIIGGLLSSTLLTLFVLPIIYDWLGGKYVEDHEETGEEIAREEADPPRVVFDRAGTTATILVLGLLSFPSLSAQTILTRDAAIERAVRVAPQLQRGTSVIGRERATAGTFGILPAPELFGKIEESPDATLTGRATRVFGIEQSFALPMRYAAQRRTGELQTQQAELEYQGIARDVRRRASMAVVELLAAQQLLRIADSAVGIASEFSRMATRRHDLGESTALEALQASLALSEAERQRTVIRGDYASAASALRTLIAASPDDPIAVEGELVPHPLELSIAELEARVFEVFPLLRASSIAVERAQAYENVVAAEKLPEFSISYSLQAIDGTGGYYGGELRMGLPIWRWMSSAPDEAAHAETEVQRAEMASVRQSLLSEVRSAASRAEARTAVAIDFRDHILPQTERAYTIALTLFREGDATYFEVLAAQSALLTSRINYIETIRNAELARIELEYLTGVEVK